DICFAAFGRREIELAENEMPSLVALRRKNSSQHVFKGARITGSLSMSIETAVLIETLTALGAEVTRSPATILHPKTMIRLNFSWKGETDEEFVWCLETQMFCLLRRSRP
ncbi:hypothetical protein BGZ74_001754, partial [Mortierella antarctica]